MPSAIRLTALLVTLVLTGSTARAADEVVEKQKKTAAANMKLAEVVTWATVETDDLIVCATLPDEKAKTFAAQLQKTYLVARKALQYEEKEQPWTGKLTVYFLTESRQFKMFMRAALGESPRDAEFHMVLKGDAPFLLDQADLSNPAAEPEAFGEAASLVAVAVLTSKAGSGSMVADWARTGFGRAVSLRAEGPNAKRVMAYRTRAKAVVVGTSGRPGAKLSDVWDGGAKDGTVLATSLMDYLAFGPKAADFPKVVNAL